MTFVGASSQRFFTNYEVRNLVQASPIYRDRRTSWRTRLDFQSITMGYGQPVECLYASVYRGHRDLAVTLVILNVPDGAGTGSWKILRGSGGLVPDCSMGIGR
jgi:hypothetical protein